MGCQCAGGTCAGYVVDVCGADAVLLRVATVILHRGAGGLPVDLQCNWLFTAQTAIGSIQHRIMYVLPVDCLSNGLCFDTLQVIFRRFILAHKYETSYIALARRAARTNNFWNRLVRKGSVMRRCAVFGALPLA